MAKILYILGAGRSGSTVLANTLGQLEGFRSIGESRHLWERGLVQGRPCGCGARLWDCELWGPVLELALSPTPDQGTIARMASLSAAYTDRTAVASLRLIRSLRTGPVEPELSFYLRHVEAIFEAADDLAPAEWLVDSSKNPMYALALSRIAGIELRLLHLVRDSRGVAFSFGTPKPNPESSTGTTGSRPVWRTSLVWDTWNLLSEYVARGQTSLRMTYEHLMNEPGKSVAEICGLVGSTASVSDVLTGSVVDMSIHHSVSGNPNRFRTGPVALEPDTRWRHEMGFRRSAVTTALTLPGLLRYGYLGPGRRSDR